MLLTSPLRESVRPCLILKGVSEERRVGTQLSFTGSKISSLEHWRAGPNRLFASPLPLHCIPFDAVAFFSVDQALGKEKSVIGGLLCTAEPEKVAGGGGRTGP